MTKFKKGDKVEILTTIADIQPLIYEDFSTRQVKMTKKQYGTVTYRDGEYIGVKPKHRRWETECYPCELRLMTKEEFKKVKNYRG